ncbi:Uncharacterised protein [Vibrio cholerae]|nr:Uncharacterised protein [Vibrio cholerae]
MVADNRQIPRHRLHQHARYPTTTLFAIFIDDFNVAVETNFLLQLRTRDFPRVAFDSTPCIRRFFLTAFFKRLFKQTIFVMQTVTHGRVFLRRARIHKTGGKTA